MFVFFCFKTTIQNTIDCIADVEIWHVCLSDVFFRKYQTNEKFSATTKNSKSESDNASSGIIKFIFLRIFDSSGWKFPFELPIKSETAESILDLHIENLNAERGNTWKARFNIESYNSIYKFSYFVYSYLQKIYWKSKSQLVSPRCMTTSHLDNLISAKKVSLNIADKCVCVKGKLGPNSRNILSRRRMSQGAQGLLWYLVFDTNM